MNGAVALINATRVAAGLSSVAVDAELSDAADAHARYLLLNRIDPLLARLGLHDEDLSLPGASVEGRAAAGASVIVASEDPLAAAQMLLDIPLHRRWLLRPEFGRIGIAAAPPFTVMNVSDGLDAANQVLDSPVVYPYDGQQAVPLAFVPGEIPDLLQATAAHAGAAAGFPLTVEPNCGQLGVPTLIELRGAQDAEVAFWMIAPGTT